MRAARERRGGRALSAPLPVARERCSPPPASTRRSLASRFAATPHRSPTRSMRKVTKGKVTIKLWDLGGQPRFRSMWERYCRGVNAIVYVVDAADAENSARHALSARRSLAFSRRPTRRAAAQSPRRRASCTTCWRSRRWRASLRSFSATRTTCRAPSASTSSSSGSSSNRWQTARCGPARAFTGAARATKRAGGGRLAARAPHAMPRTQVCCYSISAKNAVNIDITMDWLIKHSSTAQR